MKINASAMLSFLVAAFLSAAPALRAESFSFEEPFTAPAGQLPAGWAAITMWTNSDSRVIELAPFDSRLRMRRASGGPDVVYYKGTMGGKLAEAGELADFHAAAVMQSPLFGNSSRGMAFRAQNTSSASNQLGYRFPKGYYAGISHNTLVLTRDPGEHHSDAHLTTHVGTVLDSANIAPSANTDYLFTVSAVYSGRENLYRAISSICR